MPVTVGAEIGYFYFSFKTASFTKDSSGTTYFGVTYGKTDDKTTTTTTSKAYICFAPIVGFFYGVSDKTDIGLMLYINILRQKVLHLLAWALMQAYYTLSVNK